MIKLKFIPNPVSLHRDDDYLFCFTLLLDDDWMTRTNWGALQKKLLTTAAAKCACIVEGKATTSYSAGNASSPASAINSKNYARTSLLP